MFEALFLWICTLVIPGPTVDPIIPMFPWGL